MSKDVEAIEGIWGSPFFFSPTGCFKKMNWGHDGNNRRIENNTAEKFDEEEGWQVGVVERRMLCDLVNR